MREATCHILANDDHGTVIAGYQQTSNFLQSIQKKNWFPGKQNEKNNLYLFIS